MRNLLLCLSVVVLAVGCETMDGSSTFGAGLPAPNALSTADEIKIGQQMDAQVQQQTRPLNNPAIQAYVQQIGARLAANAPRQDVPYRFTVIDDPKSVNAFALPGGHMYVFTGLMRMCANEAELAGVMAHEIAHVADHHHGEMLAREMQAQAVAGMVLGKNPGQVGRIVAGLLGQGYQANFSRVNENEADQLGMDLLYKAGYQPSAMLTFMNKMVALDQQQGGGGRLFALFASHPPTVERLTRLQNLLARYPQQGGVFAERYAQVVLSVVGKS
ncbi:MAG: M48 family metallopeptidase [FCB group bacterium]|nr:M48 family metallopeptidase [FCB group bacterium]